MKRELDEPREWKGKLMSKMKVSLIVPCYNEEENVQAFFDAVRKVFDDKDYEYEIIFVNDGSRDKTQECLEAIYASKKANVVVVNFSRNFGKEAAMYAGLQNASGDLVSIIDADLQQRPEVAADMVDILMEHEEYDCVAAYQEERREGKIVSFLKKMFYKLINKTTDVEFYSGASDFRTFRRKMVDAILSMTEYYRFSKGIFSWVGFETYYIPYRAEERNAGVTKWSIKKLFKYAIDGFVSFTTFPLRIATWLGVFTSFCAIAYLFVVVIQKLCFGNEVPGYPTIVVLILLLGGIQLIILGIIGEYIARMYVQQKNRPIYIEKKVLDYKEKDME